MVTLHNSHQHNNNPFSLPYSPLQQYESWLYSILRTPYNRGNRAPSAEPRGTLWRSVSKPEKGSLSPAGLHVTFFFFVNPDWGYSVLRMAYHPIPQ